MLLPGVLLSADNSRFVDTGPEIQAFVTLEQNWSDDVSNEFYNAPQGSRLVPYDWFLQLEQAESEQPFRDASHIRELGYIPRRADPGNPDGLPIGFTKDASYEDGTAGLGVTCAACHTRLIHSRGTAFLIDGGPGMGDFERFFKSLAATLAATANQDAKFNRFATAILPAGSGRNVKAALRASLKSIATQRSEYNQRNLPLNELDRFGPGRVDAFGAIFNEVSVTFLGVPQNWQPANAPVSYPCLWDAPQHDRVQWNGAAENKTSPMGEILFGTREVGALGRNSGEVLGVFGSAEINAHELLFPRRYASTVKKRQLMEIENSLKTLWSPLWPEELGPVDPDLCHKGEELYRQHCRNCHLPIVRTAEDRQIVAKLSDEGTDQMMIKNFGRRARTGRLINRRKTLTGIERFGEEDAVGAILKHVVERVILDPALTPDSIQRTILASVGSSSLLDAVDELNPGYRMTGTIQIGQQKLVGRFDSLINRDRTLLIQGGRFQLQSANSDSVNLESVAGDVVDLRSSAGIAAAAARLESISPAEVNEENAENESELATINNATVAIGYKARPLNGVWATAPYLHNGSVPTLYELLKPASQRVKKFHVGSREFDPINIGFADDPNQVQFDTEIPGNSNSGHEYGTMLTEEEKRQLLEYLKSI